MLHCLLINQVCFEDFFVLYYDYINKLKILLIRRIDYGIKSGINTQNALQL